MKRVLLLLTFVLMASTLTPGQRLTRPRITGVAHIALFSHDIEESRAFYKDLLGFGEPFNLKRPDGGLHLTFIKINDRQYIELFPEREPGSDRLNHIAFETNDVEKMRAYLANRGVKVPDKVTKGRIGNLNFTVTDPDGHTVEFVQYHRDGWSMREKGKYMSSTRVSARALHLGISVGALDRAMEFYRDILGFQEFWRGSSNGTQLSWVNMKVPDGEDYIEFMLYKDPPSTERLRSMHHICLEVPDIANARQSLENRPARKDYSRSMDIRTGINRKRQLNLFDPDGTRVELMEPRTVDGTPTPSSTAPPPTR